jgi:hypothetical protein
VAVQFLCFTNDQKLGASAVLRITPGTSHELSHFGVAVETKANGSWVAAPAPSQWKIVGVVNPFGPRDSAIISMRQNGSLFAIIPQPVAYAIWRVRFNCEEEPPRLVVLLSRHARGATDRFLGSLLDHRSVSVLSPEMRD